MPHRSALPNPPVTTLEGSPCSTEVRRAVEAFQLQLLDLTVRNPLFHLPRPGRRFVETRTSTRLQQALFSGEPVPLAGMLIQPGMWEELRRVREEALARRNELGQSGMYLLWGVASWKQVNDEERSHRVPVVLFPVTLEGGRDLRAGNLRVCGAPTVNPVLRHLLSGMFGVSVPAVPETLLNGANRLEALRASILAMASSCYGFELDTSSVLGICSSTASETLIDLLERAAPWAGNHRLFRAISGEVEAQKEYWAQSEKSMVELSPTEFLLPTDPDQRAVLADVRAGHDVFVAGPPGTGKSQTIANAIADAVKRGKRVLLVASKRSALAIVNEKLNKAGLAGLPFFPPGGWTPREFILKLRTQRESLMARSGASGSGEGLRLAFNEKENRLLRSARILRSRVGPESREVRDVLSSRESPDLVCPGLLQALSACDLATRDAAWLEKTESLLSEFASSSPRPGGFERGIEGLPESLRKLAGMLDGLSVELWDRLRVGAGRITVSQMLALVPRIRFFAEAYRDWEPKALLENHRRWRDKWLQTQRKGLWDQIDAALWSREYRAARREVRAAVRDPKASDREIAEALLLACSLLETFSGAGVQVADLSAEDLDALARWESHLGFLKDNVRLHGKPGGDLALKDAIELLSPGRIDPARLRAELAWRERAARLRDLGLVSFIDAIERGGYDISRWRNELRSAIAIQLKAQVPRSAQLKGVSRAGLDGDLMTLNERRDELARTLARDLVNDVRSRLCAAEVAYPGEAAQLRREFERHRVRRSPHALLREVPHVFRALSPIVLANPAEATGFAMDAAPPFDIVVMDEASQLRPAEAAAVALLGRQIVLVGDRAQLPPTNFFRAADDCDDPSVSAVAGFQSVLDLTAAFLSPRALKWHYRSAHPGLIEFSRRFYVKAPLLTFPSPKREWPVNWVPTPGRPDGRFPDARDEADHVAALVLQHLQHSPGESLAVVTFGIAHRDRIQAAIEEKLARNPSQRAFLLALPEALMVRNLESVQGEERDHVIISFGYCREQDGSLPLRFGPLMLEGGERRLNVAATRARARLTVVASFDPNQLDEERCTSPGLRAVREFLLFARKGAPACGNSSGDLPWLTVETEGEPTMVDDLRLLDDPGAFAPVERFITVPQHLERLGWRVRTDWGIA